MKSRIIHCLAAFTLSVGVDVLFVYILAKLGWKFHTAIYIAFGSVSYLVMYYAISLIRRNK